MVWLSTPLMSLIDTSAVGLSASGGLLHRSLAPAVTVCDLGLYVLFCLAVTTTQLVGIAEVEGDRGAAVKATEDGLAASALLGGAAACVVASGRNTHAGGSHGGDGSRRRRGGAEHACDTAHQHCLRADSSTAFAPVLMTWVCQSACLARRDVRNP